jgi:hypothetical protein
VIDAGNWSHANFLAQRATEYLKATSREGWGGPDGVWAPFEELQICGSPRIYRLLSIAQDSLEFPLLPGSSGLEC